jgi:hypothetical protein
MRGSVEVELPNSLEVVVCFVEDVRVVWEASVKVAQEYAVRLWRY